MSNERRLPMSAAGAMLALSLVPCSSASAGFGVTTPSASHPVTRLEIAARKGTGNNQPGEADASAEPQTKQGADEVPTANSKAYAQCISYWDAGTHMTRDEWRESCKRLNQAHPHVPGTE